MTWGFSNHASTWRADVWTKHPFDETMPTAEDRVWAAEVIHAGWLLAFHPSIDVAVTHRWSGTPLAYFRRLRDENRWAQRAGPVPRYTVGDAVHRGGTRSPRITTPPPSIASTRSGWPRRERSGLGGAGRPDVRAATTSVTTTSLHHQSRPMREDPHAVPGNRLQAR